MKACVVGLLLALGPLVTLAGPQFTTDDPEPVEYRHWEIDLASQHAKTVDGWLGTAPHVEVDYGAISNLELHLLMPLSYNAPAQGSRYYGYGDTEVGAKYRFIQEQVWLPQVGVFPQLEIPTGNADHRLGTGHVDAFLPLWLQKSWGAENHKWTANGGGGYYINPGAGFRDWTYCGLVLQRQVTAKVQLGGEIYHRTSIAIGRQADTAFNLGTTIDLSDRHHLLFSAGRSIDGPTEFQMYVAYQLTIGPDK